MHRPTVSQMNDPGALKALTQIKKEGRARFLGVSTHAAQADVLNDAAKNEFYDVVQTAFNFTMAGDSALLNAIRNASAKGIGIIAMKTQASGWGAPGAGTVNQTAALKWVLNHPEISTAVPGYTNFEHMTRDFSVAYGLQYTEVEKNFLTEKNLRAEFLFANNAESVCQPVRMASTYRPLCGVRCTRHVMATFIRPGLPLMRSSIALISGIAGPVRNCGSCSTCEARCFNYVNIPKNIEDLRTIYL
jgi:hypothetical protein